MTTITSGFTYGLVSNIKPATKSTNENLTDCSKTKEYAQNNTISNTYHHPVITQFSQNNSSKVAFKGVDYSKLSKIVSEDAFDGVKALVSEGIDGVLAFYVKQDNALRSCFSAKRMLAELPEKYSEFYSTLSSKVQDNILEKIYTNTKNYRNEGTNTYLKRILESSRISDATKARAEQVFKKPNLVKNEVEIKDWKDTIYEKNNNSQYYPGVDINLKKAQDEKTIEIGYFFPTTDFKGYRSWDVNNISLDGTSGPGRKISDNIKDFLTLNSNKGVGHDGSYGLDFNNFKENNLGERDLAQLINLTYLDPTSLNRSFKDAIDRIPNKLSLFNCKNSLKSALEEIKPDLYENKVKF